MMPTPFRRLRFTPEDPAGQDLEWLVTNGLGGYASGPVAGALTRRFHGLLVASLPTPVGRVMCLNHLGVSVRSEDRTFVLDRARALTSRSVDDGDLEEFALDMGLPVWRYRAGSAVIEKRVVMGHGQNTTHVMFSLLEGGPVTLVLCPALQVRPHEGTLTVPADPPVRFDIVDHGIEMTPAGFPFDIRWLVSGEGVRMRFGDPAIIQAEYVVEAARGYDHAGNLWAPGAIEFQLDAERPVSFVVSTESWDTMRAVPSGGVLAGERQRRATLLAAASDPADSFASEMILAADQFIVLPVGRAAEISRARAAGDEPRTVIAGYHWFTDWGRDTMISLEGLTLSTGRLREAGCILRTFGHYVRDGLIPNMFPEGESLGLYHTADATLWFFHALHRYVTRTNDRATLTELLPTLMEIAERHVAGTRFGIGVDPADGLLRQGAEGYQLTWMDAKVGDWVVTPRRGKAVEINALWYNALRLLSTWLGESGHEADAGRWRGAADRVYEAFNRRFWNASAGHLFDVVDGESGDDLACRPNQLFAISLDFPALDPAHWKAVVDVVESRLLTPVGLRSLDAFHPDYQPKYAGTLYARDAAYHQGTVWAWLIGPFIDAWLRVHPDDRMTARGFLNSFAGTTAGFGVGSISEIFDAEPPFTPRGCIAQAWSVAEVLRAYRLTA